MANYVVIGKNEVLFACEWCTDWLVGQVMLWILNGQSVCYCLPCWKRRAVSHKKGYT